MKEINWILHLLCEYWLNTGSVYLWLCASEHKEEDVLGRKYLIMYQRRNGLGWPLSIDARPRE